MLYVQIAGCVVSGVQSIMCYCGSAGAPSWVDCAGAGDVTAGGAGVENFMRIISAMPDDAGNQADQPWSLGTILNDEAAFGYAIIDNAL